MRILCVSGYPAWGKVSRREMPSQHLFGLHELIDHYEDNNASVRGIIRKDVFDGGYIDFYLWYDEKSKLLKQINELVKLSKDYDIIYDVLNRCSIYLGALKRFRMMKTKLLTILHHPPYTIQLKFSNSDAYIFFNEDYKKIAIESCGKKENRYYVNEWRPDIEWYRTNCNSGRECVTNEAYYIDNGKSRRDKELLIHAANSAGIRVDYAGTEDKQEGFARQYAMNLKDDLGVIHRLLMYKSIVIPVLKDKKARIGPLGITSFLDSIALSLPVIASDNVCFAREVEENALGLIYKTGDLESLITALKTLKDDHELYNNCVLNLKEYEKYTMKDYSEKLAAIIGELV